MKEQDYIDATNISKVRIAKVVVSDIFAHKDQPLQEEEQIHIMRCLCAWEARLEHKISNHDRETRNKDPRVFPEIPKDNQWPRVKVMKNLGEIQHLVGQARAAYMNDRDEDRAKKVLDCLESAFNLCVNTRD